MKISDTDDLLRRDISLRRYMSRGTLVNQSTSQTVHIKFPFCRWKLQLWMDSIAHFMNQIVLIMPSEITKKQLKTQSKN